MEVLTVVIRYLELYQVTVWTVATLSMTTHSRKKGEKEKEYKSKGHVIMENSCITESRSSRNFPVASPRILIDLRM